MSAFTLLYHYTDEDGLRAILATKLLKPSLRAMNPKDARYGDGQYLSDIIPGTKTGPQLSSAFIRIPWQGYRFTHYLTIDVRGLEVHFGRRYVYVIKNPQPLEIKDRIRDHGRNTP